MRNYADEVIRQKRAVDFPGANIPPHEKPPFDRDTGFLIGSRNLPNIAKVILFSRLSVNIDKPARNGERILDMSALTDEVAATKLPQWQAVGLVLDQNARDLRAKRYGRLQEVISWFKAMELFRQAENERLIERKVVTCNKTTPHQYVAYSLALRKPMDREPGGVLSKIDFPKSRRTTTIRSVVAVVQRNNSKSRRLEDFTAKIATSPH